MSLAELLAAQAIKRALIVDDVYDAVPTANDIDPGNESWTTFNDDLTPEQRELIRGAYGPAAEKNFGDLIADDAYVAAVWELRGKLGVVVEPVFADYIDDQASDLHFVDLAREKLEAAGLECATSGRNFEDAAQDADLILIDLFFNKGQDEDALVESKERLRHAVARRAASPPLVILMSRSPRLEAKRDEFRDDVGLIDSGFRIIQKSDLDEGDRLERQLARLAENAPDTRSLAQFFTALEDGMNEATARTLRLMRKLRLSDIGQIQQLLLNVEGEPTGSYLVDVFDRVLQHEIEREAGIINSAVALNDFSEAKHPPPFVAGSPDLQELVARLLTQNEERLRLRGSLGGVVTFGDLLTKTDNADLARLQQALLVEMKSDTVLAVMTPVCDLQRDGAPRVLLLVGTVNPLSAGNWSYRDDDRTPAIRLGDELVWIKWNVKHIDTASHEQLTKAFDDGDLVIAARLREAHALELQQKMLSGLGRVGLVAPMPATFPLEVEAYYAGLDGRPVRLDVPALNDGAVCFVGRDKDRNPVPRLVLTEGVCDGLIDALAGLDVEQVAPAARTAFGHVTSSADLRRILTNGMSLKGVTATSWKHIPSETGQTKSIPFMGLLAWNYEIPADPLANKDLNKAGIILLVKDAEQPGSPGLGDAIRSGLVDPEPEADGDGASGTAGPAA